MTLLALLLACTDPAPREETPSTDTAAPEPPLPTFSSEDPVPGWSPEQLGAILETVRGLGLPAPLALGDDFLSYLARGDEDCPGSGANILDEVATGCTADSGVYFSGIGAYIYKETSLDGGGTQIDAAHVADFEMIDEDGAPFTAGGSFAYHARLENRTLTFDYELMGSWDDAARDDWLGSGFSGLLTAEAAGAEGSVYLRLDGGVTIGDAVLHFDALTWDSEGSCGAYPTGAIELRDAEGWWYRWDLSAACGEACAPVSFHGDDIGELCLDLSGDGLTNLGRMGPHAPGAPALLSP